MRQTCRDTGYGVMVGLGAPPKPASVFRKQIQARGYRVDADGPDPAKRHLCVSTMGMPGERYQVVVHVDAPALADPDQPGQSVLEGGAHVPAERRGAWRAMPAGW